MDNLMVLENRELRIKSIELVDIINQFREVEGNRSVLRHDTFMTKIKKEIKTLESLGLVNLQNFKEVDYVDSKGRRYPCYELNRDSMLQMLNSESTLVRYKTIEYINKLETEIKNNQLLLAGQKIQELQSTIEDFKTSIEEAKKQFKPSHKKKLNYNKTIKALSEDEEEAQFIKDWVFTTMGYTKWEDACVNDHKRILEIIGTVSRMLAINKITLV